MLSDVVSVSTRVQNAPVIADDLSKVLILGTHTRFVERFREYSDLAGMVSDGFQTTDLEYLEAQALLSQSTLAGASVDTFLIGRRLAAGAQVITGTATHDAGQTVDVTLSYPGQTSITLSGIATGADAPAMALAIVTAIQGDAGAAAVVTAADNADGTFTVTSDTAGLGFTVAATGTGAAAVTFAPTTPNVGIQEDLQAIVDAGGSWYFTLLTDRDTRDIVEAATWHESASTPHLLLAQSSEAAMYSAPFDGVNAPFADVASELKALNRTRTAVFPH
ncbi:MAG: hypothetical protein AAFU79_14905, partial [Myxococcota bacterium]